MLLNCGVGEDSWCPLDCKEIQPVHPKGNQSWIFIRRTNVEAETPILWPPDAKNWLIWKKKTWCWERLTEGGEGVGKGWDGFMASPAQCTWVWVNSRCWWWTGRPGMLQSTGSQKVEHNWATELIWTERWTFLHRKEVINFTKGSSWYLVAFVFFYYLFFILFLIILGVHCYRLAFSSCGWQGLISSCHWKVSHFSGFFCYGAQTRVHWHHWLQNTGSVTVANEL